MATSIGEESVHICLVGIIVFLVKGCIEAAIIVLALRLLLLLAAASCGDCRHCQRGRRRRAVAAAIWGPLQRRALLWHTKVEVNSNLCCHWALREKV